MQILREQWVSVYLRLHTHNSIGNQQPQVPTNYLFIDETPKRYSFLLQSLTTCVMKILMTKFIKNRLLHLPLLALLFHS